MRLDALIVGMVLTALFAASAASADKRVALVIGNDRYINLRSLEKAVNDARAVAETLKKIGFDVIEAENLDRRGMNLAMSEFTDKIAGGVGLFYYSGHGVQIGGSNYLVPVDAPALTNADNLRDDTIDVGRVLERLSDAKAKLSVVILDACRDNPFPKVAGRSLGGTRGLTIPSAPNGILIVYSAGVNQSAIDNLGPNDKSPNGLFTRELLPLMQQPGLRLDEAVRLTRRNVSQTAKAAGGEQNPAIYDQTDGDFYFVPPSTPAVATVPVPPGETVIPGKVPSPNPNSCNVRQGEYVVVNVAWGDKDGGLAVRVDPDSKSDVRTIIPMTGTGIDVTECKLGWCKVTFGCVNGWASERHLSLRRDRLYKVTGVSASDPEGLNIRRGPNSEYTPLNKIPYNATDIVVHVCQPSEIDPSNWCLITYQNKSGWVSQRFVTR